jgi:hypothetical protein
MCNMNDFKNINLEGRLQHQNIYILDIIYTTSKSHTNKG